MAENDKAKALGARLFLATMTDGENALAFIAQGAALNLANSEHITTLMSAAAEGRTEIVKAMLDSGRNVALDAQDDHGWTALITAAHRDQPDIVKLLLDADADLSVKDNMGRDALYYAREHSRVLSLILSKTVNDEFGRKATVTENPVTPMRPLRLKSPGLN